MPSVFEHHQTMLQLGDYYGLEPVISTTQINRELEKFSGDWHPYNSAKGDFKRDGLSLTSLDGGLSGEPDLTSLREHNRQHGTHYRELSFRKLTPVYEACPSIHSLIDPFKESLGRCHFLKFGVGGFFPYHRDGVGVLEETVVRLFVPLYQHAPRDFVFLLGDQRIHLEPGRPYFINTIKEHAVISFAPESVHLVLNIEVNEQSARALFNMVHSK